MGFADHSAELKNKAAGWRGEWIERSAAGLMKSAVLEGSEKNFQKVLDDAAKADQNLASLLLTTNAKAS